MALKAKRVVFAPTDGVLWLCKAAGARLNQGCEWDTDEGLEKLYELPYKLSRMRSVDADALGTDIESVTQKVKVRAPRDIATTDCACIGTKVFDLTKIDASGRFAWLYLAEIKRVGTCDLIATKTVYDDLGVPSRKETREPVLVRSIDYGEIATNKSQLGTLIVTIRACDWRGERSLAMRGKRHSIETVTGRGDWVVLKCSEGVADIGSER